jgi:beta-N-acetylhexosaminidase
MALQAGADIMLFNRDHAVHRQAFEMVKEWIQAGKIPQSRLDEAVARVLKTKAAYGVIHPQLANPDAVAGLIGTPAARQVALEAARRSITLVRDQAKLVPLSKATPWMVFESSGARGLGRALNASAIDLKDQASGSEIDQWVRTVQGRIAIVATTDALNSTGQTNLVKALIKAKIPTVVVAMRGPYDLLAFREAPTYLAAYGANPPALAAVADVLTGVVKAQGKLPVELPK